MARDARSGSEAYNDAFKEFGERYKWEGGGA